MKYLEHPYIIWQVCDTLSGVTHTLREVITTALEHATLKMHIYGSSKETDSSCVTAQVQHQTCKQQCGLNHDQSFLSYLCVFFSFDFKRLSLTHAHLKCAQSLSCSSGARSARSSPQPRRCPVLCSTAVRWTGRMRPRAWSRARTSRWCSSPARGSCRFLSGIFLLHAVRKLSSEINVRQTALWLRSGCQIVRIWWLFEKVYDVHDLVGD